ncbi:MAG: hypothetical protein Q8908_15095 [Bacteroidota bacterium]|nr:hypothetical protein [Bacteroidota bacterium]
MKKLIPLLTGILLFPLILYSQKTSNIENISFVRNGKVYLTNETSYKFYHLQVLKDSFEFSLKSDPRIVRTYSLNQISKVTKRRSFIAWGGCLGLVLIAATTPEKWDRGTFSLKAGTPKNYAVFSFLGLIAAGALINREVTLYKPIPYVQVSPQITVSPSHRISPLLTCSITIR